MKTLIDRLADKGMDLDEIPMFIGNLANSIPFDSHMTLDQANGLLRISGWTDIELDEDTFQLALSCFKVEGLVSSKKHRTRGTGNPSRQS
ncbi:MAG TPA: hypothetical protein DDW42_00925 [Desulfobacteraceae bacterium]|nr:hypothetical protein [Desulfobacteraceae bacterium]